MYWDERPYQGEWESQVKPAELGGVRGTLQHYSPFFVPLRGGACAILECNPFLAWFKDESNLYYSSAGNGARYYMRVLRQANYPPTTLPVYVDHQFSIDKIYAAVTNPTIKDVASVNERPCLQGSSGTTGFML